jgi:transketolase
MEVVTQVHATNLVKWAKDHPQVVVLSADLTSSTEINLFAETYPARFFSMGVAEQNMLGVAAGLAREGYIPFVHTFAVFIYRQALNQIVCSIAYPNLPVKMFGFLPGVTTPGGATHQAIEDTAVMRALPNMTVFEPGDATEAEGVLDAVMETRSPVYIRMPRGAIPRLFPAGRPFVPDKARVLSRGEDITLLSSGICTEEAMRAIPLLAGRGVSIEHLHVSTLKPFSDPQVLDSLQKTRLGVITMENHSIIGGLGSAVAELMAEHGIGKKLLRLGLRDTFAHGGSRPYLMRYYGLDAVALVQAVERLSGQAFAINKDDLNAVRLKTAKNNANAEAL